MKLLLFLILHDNIGQLNVAIHTILILQPLFFSFFFLVKAFAVLGGHKR